MSLSGNFLSNYIRSGGAAARSVHIERDNGAVNLLQNYQLGPAGQQVLGRLAAALQGEKINAWSLTGPYGMGKSALLSLLLALCGPAASEPGRVAWQRLRASHPSLADQLRCGLQNVCGDAGLYTIAITAGYEPVSAALQRGLPQTSRVKQNAAAPSALLDGYRQLQQRAGRPILLVLDEFGKNLEYLSYHPDRGDLFILQQLAETPGIFIMVCLHQAFEEYAAALSPAQRREWAKIQGRFEDISFVENNDHLLLLMRRALQKELPPDLADRVRQWAQQAAGQARRFAPHLPALQDQDTLEQLYPLQPVTALALAELCRRLAQYNRTLFSFLNSGHHLALPALLNRTPLSDSGPLPAVGLDALYDYFINSATLPSLDRPEAQRWLEIQDMINNAGDLPPLEQALLKSIGLLNLLGKGAVCPASAEVLNSLLELSGQATPAQVQKALHMLVAAGKLLYRTYAAEYRLWEGSDIDITDALRRQKERLALKPLEQILQQHLPLSPLVAARHALEKGTVRCFERRWLEEAAVHEEPVPADGCDGLLLYCYGLATAPPMLPARCRDGRPLLVAYAPVKNAIKEKALEISALQTLLTEREELAHDAVARREIKYRLQVAETAFRTLVTKAYAPGSPHVQWLSEGRPVTLNSSRELGRELSRLCDKVYNSCPHIRNEMINYNKLSSAAARARRELLEAMVEKAELENLGMKGFGPEVALYRSLLFSTGLHVPPLGSGGWQLTLPGSDPSLYPLWQEIEHMLSGDPQGISASAVLERLQQPPFGLRQGPAVVFLCHYILVKADEIVVFRENNYMPYLSGATLSLLSKRPELFILKKIAVSELQRSIFTAYRNILRQASITGAQKLRNQSLLTVVTPLMKFAQGLSAYARQTRQVSPAARRVLLALQNAADPLELLFHELPAALQIDWQDDYEQAVEELQQRLLAALQELARADDILQQKVQDILLQTWPAKNLGQLCAIMKEKVIGLVDICRDPELKPLLAALLRPAEDPEKWARGIAGSVLKKPLDSWQDQDLLLFAEMLPHLATRMEQLKLLRAADRPQHCGQVLLSISTPSGMRRQLISAASQRDGEVQRRVAEIMALPPEKARAVLLALAEQILPVESGD
ncbi:hypothetical protein [Desulforamulus putei]|uniref:Uncharacterized protein n=1 Tax=Desulforamulus putei DSM 12395 TaxID=1121429 RepID=A0A1M4TYU0_9FIRM|nr:hypothetical protein [Desulforamulus putei]SHE49682.1 hypothetical protein SAMN02745133_00518 [Desulforamulus putei DSM 12395]